jgi:hypothetical protein
MERLEDRSQPAVLDAVPFGLAPYGAVSLTDAGSQVNTVIVNMDGTNATIEDTSSTISLTLNAIAGGWSLLTPNKAQGPELNIVTVAINTGGGNDSVSVRSADRPVNVDTGAGSNTAIVGDPLLGVQAINAPVDVRSVGGFVALTADDSASAAAVVAVLDAGKLSNFTPAFYDITFTPAELSGLTVNGGSGGNVIYVAATPTGITTNVNSGTGADFVQVLATTGPLTVQGQNGADTVVIGDAGLTANVAGTVHVANALSKSTLIVDDSADTNAVNPIVVPGRSAFPAPTSTGTITGLAPATITWAQGQFTTVSLSSGFADDTWVASPDLNAEIVINAGEPTLGSGDTLILSAVGLTNPVITPNPALPDGQIASSNAATLYWYNIETFPVPLGLGGTFDFAPTRPVVDANKQPGYLTVIPTDTPTSGAYASAGVGWVNAGAGAFDRQTPYNDIPNSPQLARLLRDGQWGYQGGGSNNGVFQVKVAPNQEIAITAYIGDTFDARANTNIYVGLPNDPNPTLLNPTIQTFDTERFANQFVSYTGMFNPGASDTIWITVEVPLVPPNAYWTINGLDVRPVGLIAPLSITRTSSSDGTPPLALTLPGDGYSTDNYAGSGAGPFAELTLMPDYGTIIATDIDPAVKGIQILADASGNFSFSVLRPTGTGPSTITVTDVRGWSGSGKLGLTGSGPMAVSPNPYLLPSQLVETYDRQSIRRIDFGGAASPVAVPTDPADTFEYISVGSNAYTSTTVNALGWFNGAPLPFDRGGSSTTLLQDGVYNQGNQLPGDFRLDLLSPNTDYSVTVVMGDMTHAWEDMAVTDITNGLPGTPKVAGLSTPAGQAGSRTFIVKTDATGAMKLRFSSSLSSYWALLSLEVRPLVNSSETGAQLGVSLSNGGAPVAYAGSVIGVAGTLAADGTTSTLYTITGATPNSLLTITTSLGTLTTTDGAGGQRYLGTQVLANASGVATFSITAPYSTVNRTGTITVTETTGASIGEFTQDYTAVAPPSGPPPAISQRFDFNTASSPLEGGGFQSVLNTRTYSPSNGFGWKAAVNGYDRGPGTAGTPDALFRDGAWGQDKATFQVGVALGASRDVRFYYGDPYSVWNGITVQVEGNLTPVTVDGTVDRYGYVQTSGFDANNDGILDIVVNGAVWVASGMDVATTGNLPTPANGAPNVMLPNRLEFATSTIGGFASALNVYTPATGYGWIGTAPSSFVRPASMFPPGSPLTPTQKQFYGSGAWGAGTAIFAIAVPLTNPASTTYSMQVYVADPYFPWQATSFTGEGTATQTVDSSVSPPTVVTITGIKDLNHDGLITLTITGGAWWVVNGLDVVQDPTSLPAAP